MTRKLRKYLLDIKVAIESIEEYVEETDNLEAYKNNKLIRRAVEREI
ncbi:MAG: hypothetical protein WD361_06480 [Gracilimonas sp.]